MTKTLPYSREIARIKKLWKQERFDQAIRVVEGLRGEYSGNPQLLVLWASLVQLQEASNYTLDDACNALKEAVVLDATSPSAAIELGHFLDAVEDDPESAAKVFAQAAEMAHRQYIAALNGQVNAPRQLDRSPRSKKQIEAIERSLAELQVKQGRQQG